MTRNALLATALALTLPFTVLAQAPAADKPADKTTEDHPAPAHLYHDPYAVGTDCHTLRSRMEQADCNAELFQLRIIRLNNTDSQNDANEILVAVRNMFDPSIKVYLLSSEQAIAIGAYPQELDRIDAFIHKLDVPHRTYRVNFTITESDAGKRVGVEHFSMVVNAGQETSLKQGSKVPVATGSYTAATNSSQEQFTYLDVGMNFDVTLNQQGENLVMKSKVEQSSIAEEKDIASVREPVIRQSVLQGIATIAPGKPTTLGAMDVTGSTRHLDIEVSADPL